MGCLVNLLYHLPKVTFEFINGLVNSFASEVILLQLKIATPLKKKNPHIYCEGPSIMKALFFVRFEDLKI